MARPTTSIAVSVVAGLAAVATFLMGCAGILSYSAVRSALMDDLRHYGSSLSTHVAAALATPLWNFDREQVDRMLAAALAHDAVERVTLHLPGQADPAWDLFNNRHQAASGGGDSLRERRTIRLDGPSLGTIELHFTTQRVDELLARYRWWMIAAAVFAGAVLVLGLYLLLRTLVLEPLTEIAGFATRRSDPAADAPTVRLRRYQGELEDVRRSLLTMVDQLEQRNAELLRATGTLEAERSKLRAFFRLVPTGAAIVDDQVIVLETNPNLERLMGLTAVELAAGRHLEFEYQDRDGRPLHRDELPSTRAIRSRSEIIDEEIQVRRPDGRRSWLAVSASPLPGYGAAVVAADISERKQAEARLKQQLDELKRWQQVTLGREMRIRQLKAEINQLQQRLGESPRFRVESGPAPESRPDSRLP